ncbi:hypothetical protein D3C72_1378200 [compost metagenome]
MISITRRDGAIPASSSAAISRPRSASRCRNVMGLKLRNSLPGRSRLRQAASAVRAAWISSAMVAATPCASRNNASGFAQGEPAGPRSSAS